jgi:predicted component of type VI protein secretion system
MYCLMMVLHKKQSAVSLREASVKVVENPAEPGHYKSVVFLRPHFQLDELSVSLRLVTELPQSSIKMSVAK